METLIKSTNLTLRAYWLIRLRWLAIAVLCVTVFGAGRILNVSLPARTLYIIAVILLAYNLLLFLFVKYIISSQKEGSIRTVGRMITFQASADLFILTLILHFSGGVENPFFLFFVFHVVIASTLFSTLQSYLQATLAVFLFGLLLTLEYYGVLAHHSLEGFSDVNLYKNGLFVSGTFIIFSATLYLIVYMATSISSQLRKQQVSCENINVQLRKKDGVKDEYVLRLTHDIKGHLAAIQSCLGIVEDGTVGLLNEKQTDLVGRASRRAYKCMKFIKALLKLTRLRLSGRLELTDFSMKNTVFDAVSYTQNKAAAKNIEVTYEIDPKVDVIYGERLLIEETITNLLVNAVKYTPQNGKVKITVKARKDSVLIQISDTGIGIPKGQTEQIFEEFYRADNAKKIERDGTGLGLAIAKQVIETHGGKIWAENNPDKGAAFSFLLPLNPEKNETAES